MSTTRPSISALPPKTLTSEERAARLKNLETWSEQPAREALGEAGEGKGVPTPADPPAAAPQPDPAPKVAAAFAMPPKSMHVRMPIETYEMLRDIAHVTREHMNDIIARATLKECRRIRDALEKGK